MSGGRRRRRIVESPSRSLRGNFSSSTVGIRPSGGLRPTYLAQHGHEVINPALDDDFAEAVRVAQTAFDVHAPDVIVGSSRGGAKVTLDRRVVISRPSPKDGFSSKPMPPHGSSPA